MGKEGAVACRERGRERRDKGLTLPHYILTLLGLGLNNCLALLRPVAIGDFLSPANIGGYWNTLAMKWMISYK
jgi:hypothetical protein